MLHKKGKVSHDFMRNDNYNTLKDQLEMENQALLQQRRTIQSGFKTTNHQNKKKSNFKSKHHKQSNYSINQHQDIQDQEYEGNQRSTYNHTDTDITNQIKNRIHDVIRICQEDQKPGSAEYKDIVDAQKQILSYLQLNQSPNKFQKSTESLSRSKMQRINGSNKKTIRDQIANNGFRHLVSDDAMELIQQIQRKTLLQIESLRMDKIMLMKKYNQQVKDHNQEKRKRILLERKITQLEAYLEQSGSRFRATSFPLEKGKKYYDQQQIEQEDYDDQSESQENDNAEDQQEYQQHYRSSKPYASTLGSPQKKVSANQNRSYKKNQHQQPQNVHNGQTYHQNRQNIQSYQQVNNAQVPPSHFRQAQSTGGFGDNEIKDQIARLQNENSKMKQNLSQKSNPIYNPLKNQLKNQLYQLQNQVKQYENVLKNKSTAAQSQIDSLLMNGGNLINQGQKLIKIKSKPQLRSNMYNEGQYSQQMKYLKNRIQDLRDENSNLQRQGQSNQSRSRNDLPSVYTPNKNSFGSNNYFKSQTPKARSYTNNYESVLEQMRRVAGR